jgi:hypothetical protein
VQTDAMKKNSGPKLDFSLSTARVPQVEVYPHAGDAPLCARRAERWRRLGLPATSFAEIISGRPGSGKSNYVTWLMNDPELLCGVFRKVYFVSPSQHTLPPSGLTDLPRAQRFAELNAQTLTEIEAHMTKAGNGPFLIIFDDVGTSLEDTKQVMRKKLGKMIANRRHTKGTVSVLFLLQHVLMAPRWVRKLTTRITQIGRPSVEEEAQIWKSFVQGNLTQAQFHEFLVRVMKTAHTRLTIVPNVPLKEMFFVDMRRVKWPSEEESDSDSDESDSDSSESSDDDPPAKRRR